MPIVKYRVQNKYIYVKYRILQQYFYVKYRILQQLASEAVRMRGAAGQQSRILHHHLAAEGIVVDGLLDAVVAIHHHPRAAEVVGDT